MILLENPEINNIFYDTVPLVYLYGAGIGILLFLTIVFACFSTKWVHLVISGVLLIIIIIMGFFLVKDRNNLLNPPTNNSVQIENINNFNEWVTTKYGLTIPDKDIVSLLGGSDKFDSFPKDVRLGDTEYNEQIITLVIVNNEWKIVTYENNSDTLYEELPLVKKG